MKKTSLISIIGRPNAGKSTLLNEILGQKISIVTPKVQTTRSSIKGIKTIENTQLIFVDTPGIFSANKPLEKAMIRSAWSSIVGADSVAIIIDLSRKDTLDDEFLKILSHIAKIDAKKIFVFNKIDRLNNQFEDCIKKIDTIDPRIFHDVFGQKSENFIKIIQEFSDSKAIFISALKKKNITILVDYFISESPESEWLYDEDEITTAPLKFLCTEITREKLFLGLSEELPYNLTVETEKWDQVSESEVKIYQTIIVNRESHKMIVLGKNGSNIKSIGIKARTEIEKLYELKVHLFLFVKVRENWDTKSQYYANMGLKIPKF